jgi:hypothetical protein
MEIVQVGIRLTFPTLSPVQIAIAAEQIRQFEEDAEAHKLVVAECARMTAELEAANAEKDRLCGEFLALVNSFWRLFSLRTLTVLFGNFFFCVLCRRDQPPAAEVGEPEPRPEEAHEGQRGRAHGVREGAGAQVRGVQCKALTLSRCSLCSIHLLLFWRLL